MSTSPQHYDAIVIGAGFGGIRALHEFRKIGLKTKVFALLWQLAILEETPV